MGLPAVITTDQGKEFRNLLNAALMKEFRIKHRLTTCYHPQANGLDERFNQTLCNALAKNAQEDRTTWDSNLKEIIYAYNTAVQESSRHTPFEAMFGRIARLPIDYNAMDSYDPEKQLPERSHQVQQSPSFSPVREALAFMTEGPEEAAPKKKKNKMPISTT